MYTRYYMTHDYNPKQAFTHKYHQVPCDKPAFFFDPFWFQVAGGGTGAAGGAENFLVAAAALISRASAESEKMAKGCPKWSGNTDGRNPAPVDR